LKANNYCISCRNDSAALAQDQFVRPLRPGEDGWQDPVVDLDDPSVKDDEDATLSAGSASLFYKTAAGSCAMVIETVADTCEITA